MAILRGTARLLLDEHKRRPFSGSVLELSRAIVYLDRAALGRWAGAHGVELAAGVERGLSHLPHLAAKGFLDDRSFFRLLGFDEVVSCDVSDYEGADVIVDLNRELPAGLADRFDVVFEAGTLQHIFDLPAVLANVHRALKVDGRAIVGMAASHNHVDHGFYMFSPTLFYDFFSANRWRIETCLFFEFSPYWLDGVLYSLPWRIYRYEPGCIDHLSYGGFGHRQVGIFCVATKTPEATGDRVPQQGHYLREVWTRPAAEDSARRAAHPGLEGLLGRWSRKSRALLRLGQAWKLARRWVLGHLPKRRMPPLVARY